MFLTRAARCLHRLLPAILVFFLLAPTALAQDIYQQLETPFYDPNSISNNCTVDLSGSDREEMVWNFFISQGLSPAQTAGVMGNIQQESSFDPERMQIGGRSQNPYDAGDEGWGLIQWSGNGNTGHSTGDKFMELFKESGVSGQIYDLSTQLELVWQHMNNHPVVTGTFDLNHFKQITSETEAANYFRSQIEGGSDPNGIRETNASNILARYGSSSVDASASSSCVIGAGTDCTTVNGDSKILCEAEKYQGIYYRWNGGHQGYSAFLAGCPDPSNPPNNQPTGAAPDPSDHGLSGNPSDCATDCSGLVSIAVDEAFNLDYMWTVQGSMIGDGAQYWQSIPIASASAGDIVTTPEHVEIVDHVSGGTIFTFGSHQTGAKTGLVSSSISNWTTGAWHWTGPGSSQ